MSILFLSQSQSVYLSVAFWLSKIRQIFIILGDIHYDQQQHLIWQWSSTYDDDDGNNNNKNHTNASDESRECEWNVTALNVIVRREHNRVREVKRKSCIVKKKVECRTCLVCYYCSRCHRCRRRRRCCWVLFWSWYLICFEIFFFVCMSVVHMTASKWVGKCKCVYLW